MRKVKNERSRGRELCEKEDESYSHRESLCSRKKKRGVFIELEGTER